jgi:hypothetical protein
MALETSQFSKEQQIADVAKKLPQHYMAFASGLLKSLFTTAKLSRSNVKKNLDSTANLHSNCSSISTIPMAKIFLHYITN